MPTILDSDTSLDRQILACTVDLNELLPKLAERYSPVVVIRALATHVGGGLKAFVQCGVCTEEQALSVLKKVELLALDTSAPSRPS
jgi:hypothetical protein